MSRVAIFVAILAVAAASVLPVQLDGEWEMFKKTYEKSYSTRVEEIKRRTIWEKNLRLIEAHNQEAELGQHTYTLGMNRFGDMNMNELTSFMTRNTKSKGSTFLSPSNTRLPDTVDWRKHGYVTRVKNQEYCGSCWAFSAVGSLEGQHFKKTGKLVSLSEQNLVDCSRKEGNGGCFGGLVDPAFQYVIDNHGIDTEASYPYEERDLTCRFKAGTIGATATGYTDIPGGNETALQVATATVGPISVLIYTGNAFIFYKSGVLYDKTCVPDNPNHAVLVVGYGTEKGQDYWLVKNSNGEDWGMNGYIMMSRNRGNNCGIASNASYPLV